MIGRLVHLYKRLRYGATPRFRIAELPENTFGQVSGVVEALPGSSLVAPLSSRPCVYYSAVVDMYLGGTPHEVLAEHVGTPFVLRDGDACAIVDLAHARVSLRFDHTTESRGVSDAHPHHRALLERHGHRGWGANTLRYNEAVLQVGQRITVIGSGVQEQDPASGAARIYRERSPTRLRLVGSARAPLLITDRRRGQLTRASRRA